MEPEKQAAPSPTPSATPANDLSRIDLSSVKLPSNPVTPDPTWQLNHYSLPAQFPKLTLNVESHTRPYKDDMHWTGPTFEGDTPDELKRRSHEAMSEHLKDFKVEIFSSSSPIEVLQHSWQFFRANAGDIARDGLIMAGTDKFDRPPAFPNSLQGLHVQESSSPYLQRNVHVDFKVKLFDRKW